MADDAQKTPFVKSMQAFTDQMIAHIQETMGMSLPARVESVDKTNTIVTVSIQVQDPVRQFPQVKCPIIYPQYIRFPIQKGDLGAIFSADAYLGGVSGLGGGVATLARQGNLTNSVFVPLGNSSNTPTDDPQALIAYGPNGVIARTQDGSVKFVLNKDMIQITFKGTVVFQVDDNGILLDSAAGVQMLRSGSGFGIQVSGAGTMIDGKIFLPHEHTNVQSGPDQTGPVA